MPDIGLTVTLIALGGALLLFGKHLWLVGAGVGVLLGAALVGVVPGLTGSWAGVLIILGLSAALAALAAFFKGFASLIAFGIGFLAGGAITLRILEQLSIAEGVLSLLLAVGIGLVVAFLARRFTHFVIVILACLIGALLVVQGIEILIGGAGLSSTLTTVLVLLMAGPGMWFQLRKK
jgi:hypothetical protein